MTGSDSEITTCPNHEKSPDRQSVDQDFLYDAEGYTSSIPTQEPLSIDRSTASSTSWHFTPS